jgi:CRAL/TRIO domain
MVAQLSCIDALYDHGDPPSERNLQNALHRELGNELFELYYYGQVKPTSSMVLDRGHLTRHPQHISDIAKHMSIDQTNSFVSLKIQYENVDRRSSSKKEPDISKPGKAKPPTATGDPPYSDIELFSILQFNNFCVTAALRLIQLSRRHRLRLSLHSDLKTKASPIQHNNRHFATLKSQILSQTLFPLPGIAPIDDIPSAGTVFYMKPSRYHPRLTRTSDIIDNLAYVMRYCTELKAPKWDDQCQNGGTSQGLTFVANMNDWTMSHFSTDYCWKFMQCLQGRTFPARVKTFLIVNPPSWFDSVWRVMKPMLAPAFAARVHMICEDDLWQFFAPGYEKYLPTDFVTGEAQIEDLTENFVRYMELVESHTGVYKANDTEVWSITPLDKRVPGQKCRRRRFLSRFCISQRSH